MAENQTGDTADHHPVSVVCGLLDRAGQAFYDSCAVLFIMRRRE